MPRSLARGDYRLFLTVESASRAGSWYRVLIDPRTGALSCDCPSWTFLRGDVRSCKHTDLATRLANPSDSSGAGRASVPVSASADHPLIAATREQWPGLNGAWSLEQRAGLVADERYHFVLLRLVTGNNARASGVVAFAARHRPSQQSMTAGVAGWAGYTIAAEIARQAGYPLVGQPPEHFQARPGARQTATSDVSLSSILRVGDQVRLGDGLTPAQRAENTLRLFLGGLYPQLESQGFIDVPSVRYADRHRVYRLRRDPAHQHERRVRVFEQGRYVNDFCIVRAQSCPEGDHWLTVFLGLLSDEQEVLQVVHRGNVFPPFSDSAQPEPLPAVWVARAS